MKLGIDAGHGGIADPGATRPWFPLTEADWNIGFARELFRAVKISGLPFHPILIRTENGSNLSMAERSIISSNAECELVLHIHVNAAHNHAFHGGLLFHWPGNKHGEAMANQIARSLPEPLHRRNNYSFPATDLPHLDDDWLQRPRGVMQHHKCTTVLLEVGYMSNEQDAVALQGSAVQQGLILACLAGLVEYWRFAGDSCPSE